MNPLDGKLGRLFRTAAATLPFVPAPPAFGLETRVLAAWRETRGGTRWEAAVLVRALLMAALLMALSAWPALNHSANPDTENLQLADSTAQTEFTQ